MTFSRHFNMLRRLNTRRPGMSGNLMFKTIRFFTSKTFRFLLGLRSGSPLVTSNAVAFFQAERYFEILCVQPFV